MSCESVRPSTRTGTSTFAVNARGIPLTNQIAARHDDYLAQMPLGRLGEPEDVADVVVFLCSDKARFMTGQGINVTGGVYMT
jgi:NAD(P)-dependent dehydrogenase (short-subunit alcohol dehydrogenase family)